MPKSSTKFMVHQTHTQQELLSKTIVIQIEKKKKRHTNTACRTQIKITNSNHVTLWCK